MKKTTLSKSSFIRGLQCHKSLYLYKHRYFLRDRLSPEQQAKFRRGTDVGVLARQLFPGGVDLSPPTPFQYARSVEQTLEHIAQETPVIYEAAFRFNSVLVALDILEYRDGKWYGYEVKSSLAISETYLNDVALQYHVIQGSGTELTDISIIYMNKDFVLQGDLDLSQLFLTKSVLDEAQSRQPMIAEEIAAQLKVVELTKSPAIDIGPHCNKPYPCDFQGHCWKHIPKNSIFELQWLSEAQKFELYLKKILQIEDIPDDYLSDPVQKMKLRTHKTSTPHIDKDSIRQFVENIQYPLCFLKAWYHRPAVPLFDGTKPYEKLPFCLSLRIKHDKNSLLETRHHFFEPEANPLPVYRELLTNTLSQCAAIITYDDKFAEGFSAAHTLNKLAKPGQVFFDMHDVFASNLFYDPKTNGDTRLVSIAAAILKDKLVFNDIFNSETEAGTAFMASMNNTEETVNFRRIMQQTSEQHLMWMEEFFGSLSGS